jgi:hypothetical protein
MFYNNTLWNYIVDGDGLVVKTYDTVNVDTSGLTTDVQD